MSYFGPCEIDERDAGFAFAGKRQPCRTHVEEVAIAAANPSNSVGYVLGRFRNNGFAPQASVMAVAKRPYERLEPLHFGERPDEIAADLTRTKRRCQSGIPMCQQEWAERGNAR